MNHFVTTSRVAYFNAYAHTGTRVRHTQHKETLEGGFEDEKTKKTKLFKKRGRRKKVKIRKGEIPGIRRNMHGYVNCELLQDLNN